MVTLCLVLIAWTVGPPVYRLGRAGGPSCVGGGGEVMIGVTNCLAVAVAMGTAPPTGRTRLVCRWGADTYRVCLACADPADLVAIVTDGIEVSLP